MKKLLNSLAIAAIGLGLLTGVAFAASSSPIDLQCDDIIAGYSSGVELNTLKDTSISFMLETPNGRKVYLQEKSDKEGELALQIADYHLQAAGPYAVSARFTEQNEDFGQRCTFTVYPSDVSTTKSLLSVDQKTAEAGLLENIVAEVHLRDDFGNSIKGHSVELLSSRTEDSIQLLSHLPYTDDNGAISFLVNSEEPGMTTLSAIDLTEDITLNARTKIAFLEANSENPIGGNSENFNYGNYFDDASIFLSSLEDTGEIYEFIIEIRDEGSEDVVTEVMKNSALSTTVTALDELGNIVPNYTGEIRFSSTDDNAALPEDYKFTSGDLGTHDFDLGITFKTEGPHILSINDTENFSLKGEVELEVKPKEITATPDLNREINLISPKEGTFSKNTIDVSGTTAVNTTVQIYDEGTLKEETISDESGKFATALKDLEEGTHKIQIKSLNEEGEVASESAEIRVDIDTVAPVIELFEISPEGTLEAESEVTVTLTSEMGLDKVSLLFEERIIELTESLETPGSYETTFPAPAETGEYKLDVVLKDTVGNEGSFPEQSILKVQKDEIIIPSIVTEISAIESDSRITLTWAAAEDDTYITRYKISYGYASDKLYLSAQTFDSSTTWYIPELENGQEYYFGIQGIDSEGNEGEMSELIASTPMSPEPELPASLEDPIILEELPPTNPETGPELWFMIIASLLIADIFYRNRSRA